MLVFSFDIVFVRIGLCDFQFVLLVYVLFLYLVLVVGVCGTLVLFAFKLLLVLHVWVRVLMLFNFCCVWFWLFSCVGLFPLACFVLLIVIACVEFSLMVVNSVALFSF